MEYLFSASCVLPLQIHVAAAKREIIDQDGIVFTSTHRSYCRRHGYVTKKDASKCKTTHVTHVYIETCLLAPPSLEHWLYIFSGHTIIAIQVCLRGGLLDITWTRVLKREWRELVSSIDRLMQQFQIYFVQVVRSLLLLVYSGTINYFYGTSPVNRSKLMELGLVELQKPGEAEVHAKSLFESNLKRHREKNETILSASRS